jgi:hypothetical protein
VIVVLSRSLKPCVADKKAGTRPIGSTTSNSVTKADIAKSTKGHPSNRTDAAGHSVNLRQAPSVSFAERKLMDVRRARTDFRSKAFWSSKIHLSRREQFSAWPGAALTAVKIWRRENDARQSGKPRIA